LVEVLRDLHRNRIFDSVDEEGRYAQLSEFHFVIIGLTKDVHSEKKRDVQPVEGESVCYRQSEFFSVFLVQAKHLMNESVVIIDLLGIAFSKRFSAIDLLNLRPEFFPFS
jgi:hypothetical protein